MKKLEMRIQRNNNLNDVLFSEHDDDLHNGVHHRYIIVHNGYDINSGACSELSHDLFFQKGPRKEPTSKHGVLESDLLEIVRHRLQGHQKTEYATRENAVALTHIEEALMWMSKRVDDRAERSVLGTDKK